MDLDPAKPEGDPTAAKVATYLAQAIDEIHLSGQDIDDRAVVAPEGFTHLMMICGEMAEGDLPDIWCLIP
jgi:hypothetical protein